LRTTLPGTASLNPELADVLPHSQEIQKFGADVVAGLSQKQKSIPCRYFYDATGGRLFERITSLPEYYPTRTEIAILEVNARRIAGLAERDTVLVELGSGSSIKTDIVIAACPGIRCYVPIDLDETMLGVAKQRLERTFPGLVVFPVHGDFTGDVTLPACATTAARVGFFPGSTIGNFGHDAAVQLLARLLRVLGDGSLLIVGADLRKSSDILVPAYNDAQGVTAAFNLNLLERINRELAGTFDIGRFRHEATYDVEAGRIDMWLVSLAEQSASAAGHTFHFGSGERIHTEISQKYHIEEFRGLARRAGWTPIDVWTDPQRLFSVHVFGSGSNPRAPR
jgi:dimethylhistidine N-methyltransferase